MKSLKLTKIDLRYTKISSKGILALANSDFVQNIKWISLLNSKSVIAVDLEILIEKLISIEHLDLSSLNLNDNIIKIIGKTLKNVKKLKIYEINNISSEGKFISPKY